MILNDQWLPTGEGSVKVDVVKCVEEYLLYAAIKPCSLSQISCSLIFLSDFVAN